jgi:class 3 adenylate cyclase/Icc-related predicted phosphoesterase/tetratricopeptide (TPR) repeat protein
MGCATSRLARILPAAVERTGVPFRVPRTQPDPRLLVRYVPRLASEWEYDAPGRDWQEIDSTLCFVDLSGFTALSERLARLGRIGAEELTEVLNRVFGEMLDVAYAHGGSLAKFGGDALLLHYAGKDHAFHAAAAAVEMRSALRRAAQHKTSVGRVALRMSVGIHTGVVNLFRAGRSHTELVVSGPAASRVALMESIADAGEILLSPETAARLPQSALGHAKGDGILLRWRRSPIGRVDIRLRRDVDYDAVERGVPLALRQVLGQDAIEPEHRLATVGFVKFEGVDEIMSSNGPEAVAAALHELVTAVQVAADRAGVTFLATDVDKNGGKVILVAGVPFTQDDDDGRMLGAVREILDAKTWLRVRAGVNRGHVFAGEVGSAYRATYTIIGDTVNLAARLMAAAPTGALYAAPEVVERSRTLFATEALEPFNVKGKSQPVRAVSVGSAIGMRSQRRAHALPFFGRDAEVAVVRDALAAAVGGDGSVLNVVGDAGAGKSRLIDEALLETGDLHVIRVQSEQSGSKAAYRGLRDPMRALLGIARGEQDAMAAQLRDAVTACAPHLLPVLPLIGDVVHVDVQSTPEVESIDVRFRPARTGDAVVELLNAFTTRPLVMIFDDAQWMDSASAELVERLAGAVRERPWLLLVVRRPGKDGPDLPSTAELELGPLSAADARALVLAATASDPLRPHELELIVTRSGGSPLFVEEVLRLPRAGGIDNMPATLDAVVNAEIDGLGAGPRRLVRYASVLGRSFRVAVLRELLTAEGLRLDLATLREVGRILERDGHDRVRFRQEMHREVAYEGLTYKRRRELHLRAGEITERMAGGSPDTVADLLAMHFALGQHHALAWRYARIAGDRARERYANVEAVTQYQRAIDAGRRLGDAVRVELRDVWRLLGDVREQLGLFEDAIAAYRNAGALAQADDVVRADLLWRRARVRMHLGAYRQALAEASRGVALLAGRADQAAGSVRARLIALQAWLRQAQQRAAPAAALASRAVVEAQESGDDTALARAYLVSEWANRVLGISESMAYGELALELYERIGDLDGAAKASNNLGAIAYFDGRWDDALRWYRRALDFYARCGNDTSAAVAGTNLAELLVSRGALAEAATVLNDAIRVLRAAGALDDVLFAEIQLGRLMVERGEAEAAVAVLTRVRPDAAAVGQVGYAFEAALQLASGLSALGRFDEALRTLEDAVREVGFVDPVYQPSLARVRAAALAGCGRPGDALREIEDGVACAREQGLAYEEALLLHAAARLEYNSGGRPSEASLDAMVSILTRLNLQLPPWDEGAPRPADRTDLDREAEALARDLALHRDTDDVRVLLVSDLHYVLRQYDWVVDVAGDFDVVVIAGDLLDGSSPVELDAQTVVVLKYLELLASRTQVVVGSGNHDLTGTDAHGERAATWLADARRLGVTVDGESLSIGDTLITVCPWWDGPAGRAAVVAQLAADAARRPRRWIWVYHWPPLPSSTAWTGTRQYGDADLTDWIDRYRPDVVLCGHVHDPPFKPEGSWADRIGETWVFNAGRQIGGTPTRIELSLGSDRAAWISFLGVEEIDMRETAAPVRTLV